MIDNYAFELGQVLATPLAIETFTAEEIGECLFKHMIGQWGDVCAEDAMRNMLALKSGARLMSVYKLSNERTMWIITEAKDDNGFRSATTVLLPDEY